MNVLLVDRANYKRAIENLITIVNDKKVPNRLDLLPVLRLARYYRPYKQETSYISNIYDNIVSWGQFYETDALLSLSQHFIDLALDIIPV